jgi:pimeloyl-ACP methyl ester carboxylesterase
VRQDVPVDGFRLAYRRAGQGPAVLLLHGWPGDRADYRDVLPLVSASADVVLPDLRGFGESDKHPADPAREYSAAAQARSLIALIGELQLDRAVIAGYDIGSRIAQTIALQRPDLVSALVLGPPLPGIGERILRPRAQQEFWYQAFHQLSLCTDLIDGDPGAVRRYLRHVWTHWSGPGFELASETSSIWSRCTGRPARSPRLFPGTGQALGRWPARSASSHPARRTGSPCRSPCCGLRTTRCSRPSGRTGSATTLPTPP